MKTIVIILAMAALTSAKTTRVRHAYAKMQANNESSTFLGYLIYSQPIKQPVQTSNELVGFNGSAYEASIHERGNLPLNCSSIGPIYSPKIGHTNLRTGKKRSIIGLVAAISKIDTLNATGSYKSGDPDNIVACGIVEDGKVPTTNKAPTTMSTTRSTTTSMAATSISKSPHTTASVAPTTKSTTPHTTTNVTPTTKSTTPYTTRRKAPASTTLATTTSMAAISKSTTPHTTTSVAPTTQRMNLFTAKRMAPTAATTIPSTTTSIPDEMICV